MTFLKWLNDRRDPSESIKEVYGQNMNGKTGCGQCDIRIGKNYNGSGKTAFGGASEWPAVNVNMRFPVETTEEEVQTFLHEFRMLLNKHGYS